MCICMFKLELEFYDDECSMWVLDERSVFVVMRRLVEARSEREARQKEHRYTTGHSRCNAMRKSRQKSKAQFVN